MPRYVRKTYVICPVNEEELSAEKPRYMEKPCFNTVSGEIHGRSGSLSYPYFTEIDGLRERVIEHKERLVKTVEELLPRINIVLVDLYETEAEAHGNDFNAYEYRRTNEGWIRNLISRNGKRLGNEPASEEEMLKVVRNEKYASWDSMTLVLKSTGIRIELSNWLQLNSIAFWLRPGQEDSFKGHYQASRSGLFMDLDLRGTEDEVERIYQYFKGRLGTHFIDLDSSQFFELRKPKT